ncbi:MAG: hypothetical protein Kow0088_24480 [Anaerolineales bacterium]
MESVEKVEGQGNDNEKDQQRVHVVHPFQGFDYEAALYLNLLKMLRVINKDFSTLIDVNLLILKKRLKVISNSHNNFFKGKIGV